jgi:polysaccharide deacetylase family protein (PEP-CTERM system associated)
LELLADYDVSGTFFIVGWIAERQPDLVTAIHQAGHEIASHSFWHRLVYRLTPDEFREDLIRSRDVLEDIVGQRVTIFRAPSFSITDKSRWALEILVEEGFQVDSSIFPVHHDRYGIPNANPGLHPMETKAGRIWECPPSIVRLCGMNLPVSGGGYFRLYPGSLTKRLLRRVNCQADRPFVFYVHPWEVDPHQPRLMAGSLFSRFRHYVNLHTTEAKLSSLLSAFRFGSISQVLEAECAEYVSASINETRPNVVK